MNKSSIKSEEQKIKEKQVNLYLQNSRLRTTRGIY